MASRSEGAILKQERFYRVVLPAMEVGSIVYRQRGVEGEGGWMERDAARGLREAAQRWAVEQAGGAEQGSDE